MLGLRHAAGQVVRVVSTSSGSTQLCKYSAGEDSSGMLWFNGTKFSTDHIRDSKENSKILKRLDVTRGHSCPPRLLNIVTVVLYKDHSYTQCTGQGPGE